MRLVDPPSTMATAVRMGMVSKSKCQQRGGGVGAVCRVRDSRASRPLLLISGSTLGCIGRRPPPPSTLQSTEYSISVHGRLRPGDGKKKLVFWPPSEPTSQPINPEPRGNVVALVPGLPRLVACHSTTPVRSRSASLLWPCQMFTLRWVTVA